MCFFYNSGCSGFAAFPGFAVLPEFAKFPQTNATVKETPEIGGRGGGVWSGGTGAAGTTALGGDVRGSATGEMND